MISVEEALERALRGLGRLASERVAVDDAEGRVLAEDLATAQPMPAFTQSAMDGYAVRASFFQGDGPWTLRVHGESRAGGAGPALEHGGACRIFTGAPIVAGANAVIKQEDVSRSEGQIVVSRRPQEGENIRPAGADLPQGTIALEAGTRLSPAAVGLVAGLDRAHVVVARRPSVSILATGDELRSPGVPGSEVTIAESNSFVVAAAARRVGAVARIMPALADDAERTELEIRRALRGTDLLVTIGGASVGDHDLVRPAMEAVGVSIDFWGVAIKPGKPVAVGSHGSSRVLVLPGNPASATLTFLLFGVPMLRAMQGESRVRPRRIPLRVIGAHARKPGRDEFLRARLELHDGELCAVLPASQSSGAVHSFAHADALVVLAADRKGIKNGERLPVIPLADIWG
jgi:molybdopterin molybdotransferase